MEFETGIFKRYERKRGNKKVTQVGVSGLSVNSKYKDGEEIIVLSKEEFTELENQLNIGNDKIQTLTQQLNEANTKLETLENTAPEPTPENPKHYNKVIELQELINNRNGLLMETQTTINRLIGEVTKQYNELGTEVTTANETTKDNISTLIDDLQTITSTVLDYCNEMETQVNGINSSIDNTSWFKWIRSKDKFKIVMDLDKLKQLETELKEFNTINSISKAKELITPIEIPTNKLEELTTEGLDLNKLFIGNKETSNENPDIPSKVITEGNNYL